MTFGDLFTGIGGFSLGLERAGMVCKWQVEISPFCQQVLTKHWPDVERFGDVRECGRHNLATVDLIAGGFPCQPHSVAGQQRGAADDRNLWPEYRRVVAELRPAWVLAENVPGIRGTILDDVLSDLEGLAYKVGTIDIPACGVGAWHRRHRIFIIAHAARDLWATSRHERPIPFDGCSQSVPHTECFRCGGYYWESREPQAERRMLKSERRDWWAVEPDVGRVVNGIPNRVDRLRALGNAVVPQVAEWIGRRISTLEAVR